jgi:hypothetical protein
MRFYHRTTADAARSILSDGFRDTTGYYLTEREWCGVWLSDEPLDPTEARFGAVLRVTIEADDFDLDFYEWAEDGKEYREWLIPAAIVNRSRIELIEDPIQH